MILKKFKGNLIPSVIYIYIHACERKDYFNLSYNKKDLQLDKRKPFVNKKCIIKHTF